MEDRRKVKFSVCLLTGSIAGILTLSKCSIYSVASYMTYHHCISIILLNQISSFVEVFLTDKLQAPLVTALYIRNRNSLNEIHLKQLSRLLSP